MFSPRLNRYMPRVRGTGIRRRGSMSEVVRARTRKLPVVAFAAVLAAAGCSTEGPDPNGTSDEQFDYILSYAWDEAEELGASPEQFDILEQAREQGELSFELYSEAIDNSLRCLREEGVEPHDGGVHHEFGYPRRSYGVPVEAEAADPVEFAPGATVHRCIALHSLSVEGAYQNQPSSLEAQESHRRSLLEPHREAIVECVLQEGIEVDVEGDILRIGEAAKEAFHLEETDVDCTEGMW